MSEYAISQIYPSDTRANAQVNTLLEAKGIRRDANLDYTCGMYDDEMNIVATGSCFGNTLRCMAVSSAHQGEGLMNQIVFMENRRSGFQDYLKKLKNETNEISSGIRYAALVMNANPFTLGHQYLVEKAAAENDILHLFLVSEDASLVPFAVRKKLVMDGTAHLHNIIYHESGPYIISNATFPSYFQKDATAVMESHANLDLTIFVQIAQALGINSRYVGEDPNSEVTGIYNQIMATKLPENGIECHIIPRKEVDLQLYYLK